MKLKTITCYQEMNVILCTYYSRVVYYNYDGANYNSMSSFLLSTPAKSVREVGPDDHPPYPGFIS